MTARRPPDDAVTASPARIHPSPPDGGDDVDRRRRPPIAAANTGGCHPSRRAVTSVGGGGDKGLPSTASVEPSAGTIVTSDDSVIYSDTTGSTTTHHHHQAPGAARKTGRKAQRPQPPPKKKSVILLVSEASTKLEAPSWDRWTWRKYGQKPIKGSPYPRGYYRCSSAKGCSARKQVERSAADPTHLVVTYTSDHNHDIDHDNSDDNSVDNHIIHAVDHDDDLHSTRRRSSVVFSGAANLDIAALGDDQTQLFPTLLVTDSSPPLLTTLPAVSPDGSGDGLLQQHPWKLIIGSSCGVNLDLPERKQIDNGKSYDRCVDVDLIVGCEEPDPDDDDDVVFHGLGELPGISVVLTRSSSAAHHYFYSSPEDLQQLPYCKKPCIPVLSS